MENASVYRGFQFGLEAIPGTPVAANRRLLQPIFSSPMPEIPVAQHRGAGAKANVAAVVGKEHTEQSFEGVLGFNELLFLLSAHLLVPSGPTANAFVFKPATFGPDTIKTFTVQTGSSAQAERFAYGFVPDVQMRFTLVENSLSGAVHGRGLEDDAALTANPTVIPHVPVPPKGWKVLVGEQADMSDLTELTRVLEFEFSSQGKWAGRPFADPTQGSFTTIVERAAELTAQLVLQHDSESAAFMDALRGGELRFLRLLATGPEISPGVDYQLQIDFPFRFINNDRGEDEELATSTFDLEPAYDAGFDTSGGHLKITLTCASTLA